MKIEYTVEPLEGEDIWSRLTETLGGGNGNLEVARNTVRHLRVLQAKSYVIEAPYIDRDYSADYVEFYARTFRTHQRHCKRVHFFSIDMSPLLKWPLTTEGLREFQAASGKAYPDYTRI